MKLREPTDDQGQPMPPFQRSVEAWQAMGAGPELWDQAAAARAWVAIARRAGRLDDLASFAPAQVEQAHARRYWRRARPAFLAEHGLLTDVEARILARLPRRP